MIDIAMTQQVESKIFLVRGRQVMLGVHLAEMYEVAPEALERAVECGLECFPEGAVFRLEPDEWAALEGRPDLPGAAAPYVFTGPGMAVLASLLLDENLASPMQDTCAPACGCHG